MTWNPTLYEGLLLYWSNIIVSVSTCTKEPRAKNTPSVTVNADPVNVALLKIQVAKSDPAVVVVLPKVKSDKVTRFSPSWKVCDVLSLAFADLYFTYIVVAFWVDFYAFRTLLTTAVTPDDFPFISNPTNLSK